MRLPLTATMRSSSRRTCVMVSGACCSLNGSHSACRSFQNSFWYSSCGARKQAGWPASHGEQGDRVVMRHGKPRSAAATRAPRPIHLCIHLYPPTVGTKSQSSTASYPLRRHSTAKLSWSVRRGKATGRGGSGSSCGSDRDRLLLGAPGPGAVARARGGRPAADVDQGRSRQAVGAAAAASSRCRRRLDRPACCCAIRCCSACCHGCCCCLCADAAMVAAPSCRCTCFDGSGCQ